MGLCDFRRAKAPLKVCFRIDSGLLKEGRMNPSGEQNKTKSRRNNEKVFLSYCWFSFCVTQAALQLGSTIVPSQHIPLTKIKYLYKFWWFKCKCHMGKDRKIFMMSRARFHMLMILLSWINLFLCYSAEIYYKLLLLGFFPTNICYRLKR